MEQFNFTGLSTLLLLPVLMGLFRKQFFSLFSDYLTYCTRKFDDDKNPATGQSCYIQCPATGIFSEVYIKQYKFGLFSSERRIVTVQNCSGIHLRISYTYDQWKHIVKGRKLK